VSDQKKATPPKADCGADPAAATTVACKCAQDFVITATCTILKAGGDPVQITASELPGKPAGTYTWTTASHKITLSNANTSTVSVTPLATPSAGREAEVITVTRKFAGCPDISKTVKVTVAKVTFSVSASQRYGYDDFDTPANTLDDHVSVKKSDYTFVKVQIAGGAVGTDFNFVCDPADVCDPAAPAGTATFDLRLNAQNQDKKEATLHAKCKCPAATSFTHIQVHVYKEVLVEVVVAKIDDRASDGTALHWPAMDAAGHTAKVNAKVKAAVVKYDITNYDASNGVTHVTFDSDNNGALSFDINGGGGAEVTAIGTAMTGTGTKTRIAVVKRLKSYYYLSEDVAVGGKDLKVRGDGVFNYASFPNVPLGLGANKEPVTVHSTAGNVITLAAGVTKAHAAGTPIEFIAAGWSSDPIILTEENSVDGSVIAEDNILWSIPHEAGHRKFLFADVDDKNDLMHHQQSWTDHRLRYCPRTKYYTPAEKENQWEMIPR